MPKKMFDILPPKEAHKVENTIKELSGDAKKNKGKKKEIIREIKKERKFPLKEILIGGVIILLLLAVYGITKLPKASVQIWPNIDVLSFSDNITAGTSISVVDLTNKTIPAKYVEETKAGMQEFEATGSASNDGKATGTIKVYNKTDSAFTLVKGTHFLSDSGKYFVTLERITIAAKKNNAPGSIGVQVQAEESGKDYNIGLSKFSAPKLYGTPYYYNIYGESKDAMSGGYTGNVKKVTDDDIKQAKDSLTKKLLQEATDSLKSRLSPDDVLLDGAVENSIIEADANVKSGSVADKFNESAKVKIWALVFKKQDLEKLVTSDIVAQLPANNDFLQKSVDIAYNTKSIDVKSGKLVFGAKVSVKTYYMIKTDELIGLFSIKSSDQIKKIVDQMYSGKVSELKVDFWPFWVHKAPDDKKRIKVDLNF